MPHHTDGQETTELDNLTYDIISTLAEKSDGLAVMEQYIQDAEDAGNQEVVRIFQECVEFDQKIVSRLMRALRTNIGGQGGASR
jgi:hypothetical protein